MSNLFCERKTKWIGLAFLVVVLGGFGGHDAVPLL